MSKVNQHYGKSMTDKKRNSCKTVLQFWNGGANSTYLLLQNLLSGNELFLHYIDIPYQKAKRDREIAAQLSLKEDIKKFCEYFNCRLPQYAKNSKINVFSDLFDDYHLSQPLAIMSIALSLSIKEDFDEIHLGNSCENYATITQQKLIKAYGFAYRVDSDILFPLDNVSKETVYLTLKSYDELLGTKFLEHISVCDNEFNECDTSYYCDDCKKMFCCEACIEREKIFKNLNLG